MSRELIACLSQTPPAIKKAKRSFLSLAENQVALKKHFRHSNDQENVRPAGAREFPIAAGVIDQWCGPPLIQALRKAGLNQIWLESFTRRTNSEVYTTLKTLYLAKQISVAGGWDSPLVQEMLTLQKQVLPNYLIRVEAPKIEGFHDDISDSFARMVWAAYTRGVGESPKKIITTNRGRGSLLAAQRVLARPNETNAYTGRTPGIVNKRQF